jgi:hypothetical protein
VKLPAEIRELIASKFGSAEQLDVFVLLFRSAGRWWSPAEVASALGAAPESAGMRLFLLGSSGLLSSQRAPDLQYAYLPDPAIDPWAGAISEAWDEDRGGLYTLVPGGASADPARQFADAFKLRKP